MDPSSLQDQVTYDDEFRLAIRAIPIREITLHVWEIAKSIGSHVVPVGRPPLTNGSYCSTWESLQISRGPRNTRPRATTRWRH
jgi:hypothetical protein